MGNPSDCGGFRAVFVFGSGSRSDAIATISNPLPPAVNSGGFNEELR
jgi:hypothetical protein